MSNYIADLSDKVERTHVRYNNRYGESGAVQEP